MTFELLQQLIQNLDVQNASGYASLASFFFGIQNYFAEKKAKNEQATLDDYLERLRRQDHQQLVDLIYDNRQKFELLFSCLQSSVVDAITQLDANMERRHKEISEYEIDPHKISIKTEERGWHAEMSVRIDGGWQECKLRNFVTIVNRNHSKLTVRRVTGVFIHDDTESNTQQELKVQTESGPTTIDGQGASERITLFSVGKVRWRKGEVYTNKTLALDLDQTDEPLIFRSSGTEFEPE